MAFLFRFAFSGRNILIIKFQTKQIENLFSKISLGFKIIESQTKFPRKEIDKSYDRFRPFTSITL